MKKPLVVLIAVTILSAAYAQDSDSFGHDAELQKLAREHRKQVERLHQKKISLLEALVELHQLRYKGGVGAIEPVLLAYKQLAEAKFDATNDMQKRVALTEELVEKTKELERVTKIKSEQAEAHNADLYGAQVLRVDAELLLLKAKRELANASLPRR